MDARLVASRLPAIPMYGQPFNTPHFPGYLSYGPPDASAFYSPLQTGENADVWRAGLNQAAAAAYYDPTFAAHYGYGYGPMGLSDGARRKNATRETTSTLKAWLNEHRKNPYPTKGEKIMLAIITKMTLTQVSTWFANARRRLKKENKMTWSPRNRCGEDDDDDVMDGDDDNNLNNNGNSQMREGHSSAGERSGSRSSTPSTANVGSTTSDGQHRVSSFDLPHQNNRNPFLSRPDIIGSFTIQGPAGRPAQGPSRPHKDHLNFRNSPKDDEEIDLESIDEDRKESAFVKRSISSEIQSNEENTQRREASPSISGTSQLPGVIPKVPSHPAFHPATSNSMSLLARHHMHPQPHSFQPSMTGFGPAPSKIGRRDSSSPRSHPYSRNAVSSPTSSVASMSSASPPLKPKIWSLADVATSNEGAKNSRNEDTTSVTARISSASLSTSPTPGIALFGGRHPMQGLPPHHQSPLNPEAQATIRNWMDGVMQQKMAAAAAAAMSGGQGHPSPFFPGTLLQQHLAAAFNPAAFAVASLPRGPEGVRFPHSFPGFAELAAAQRAQMTTHAAGFQTQTVVHTASAPLTPTMGNKLSNESVLRRHRIGHDEKRRSPTSVTSSPTRSEGLPVEVSSFSALNTRPESGDSGIASAETSKENMVHSNELPSAK